MSKRTNEHLAKEVEGNHVPVKILWKAPSTFEASKAEVSMNDNPFSAIQIR